MKILPCILQACILPACVSVPAPANEPASVTFDVELEKAASGFDGKSCWVHARAGVVPASARPASQQPLAVMTTQKLLLSGSDVFYALNQLTSEDGGKTWSPPQRLPSFVRQTFQSREVAATTGADIAPELLQAGDETTVCDFVPQWHARSQRLLGIGHTVWYRDNRVMKLRPRGIAWAVYNHETQAGHWSDWQCVKLPDEPKFKCAGSGSQQRWDLPNGDILLPVYLKEPAASQYACTVIRCSFDGSVLKYIEHGSELTIPVKRGLYEPSITRFGDEFFLTMRNDEHGYVARSRDGLVYSEPQRWTFDDGQDLGNYNTQQHWVVHSDGLFLVYTRRAADNDHVFRHRAPLFIAQVDPARLQIIRRTERVLVPERGARLGNFGVTQFSPEETWVTAAEWMQPEGVEKHGSDNTIWVARIKWSEPNRVSADAAESNRRSATEQPDSGEVNNDLPAAAPAEVGMNETRLSVIDEIVAEGIERGRMPGCVVLVGHKGRVVYRRAFGHRQLVPEQLPMQTDTVFDLASLTKPIATATSVMKLVESGQVDLNAPIATYIPEFGVNGKAGITVRQLLTHTGGLIPDNSIKDYADGPSAAFARIHELETTAEPGSKFIYTDVGFIVLAELVERVTGMSIHEYSQQQIFGPLHMTETGYLPSESLAARAAVTQERDGQPMRGQVHDPRAFALGGIAGHAGLFSTADDLARYAQMLVTGGSLNGTQILKPETVQQMTAPVQVSAGLRTMGWDMRSTYSSNRGDLFSKSAFGHGGFTGTALWIDPAQQLFVIFLSNRVHPDGKGSVNALAGRIGTIAAAAIDDQDDR